jgi:hypothetical protein
MVHVGREISDKRHIRHDIEMKGREWSFSSAAAVAVAPVPATENLFTPAIRTTAWMEYVIQH